MIEHIEKLISKIQANEKEIKSMKEDADKIDTNRLISVIEIARKGIKFEKIYENEITYNNWNSCYSDEVTYFKDDQGKFLKGVKICEKSLKYNRDSYGGNKEERELFLLEDGSFRVFYLTGEWSNWQDGINNYSREISKYQGITQFDTDEIIENIEKILARRLEELGERKKVQLMRLEKLKALKLS